MKILILSCNTGGGHNVAAAAMKEYFSSVGVSCDIRDALAFRTEIKSKIISRGHVFVYKRAPHLFGAGYRFFEHHPPKKGQSSVMYETVKSDSEDLYAFLQKNTYDLILCTHLFAAMIVTEMKRKYGNTIRNYLIITDYTCYPGINEIEADRIFMPHEQLLSEFVENGIPSEKVIPSGIPVKTAFYQKEHAKCAKRRLGLPDEGRMVLMMCGSMGCGPLPALARRIYNKLPEDTVLTVICGSNTKLFEKIQKMKHTDRMQVVGFTDQISLYMDAADVILTKPGGLSSTEAATKGLPMVLIDAVPGCETKNMDFYIQNGFALTAGGTKALADTVVSLLLDEKKREQMTEKLNASFSSRAADTIGKVILSEVQYTHG